MIALVLVFLRGQNCQPMIQIFAYQDIGVTCLFQLVIMIEAAFGKANKAKIMQKVMFETYEEKTR